MFVPAQGLRHAAALLLTNRARAIPPGASAEETHIALERLARELVALADDTHAPAEASEWLVMEFNATVDRLPQSFDRLATKSAGAAVLARVASRVHQVEARDLFLIYAPEDRLPVAAPLAVELTKRRISVAFAEYEVATAAQIPIAIAHGLASHRGGVVLWTKTFERLQQTPLPVLDRVRVLCSFDLSTTVADLTAWAHGLRVSRT